MGPWVGELWRLAGRELLVLVGIVVACLLVELETIAALYEVRLEDAEVAVSGVGEHIEMHLFCVIIWHLVLL